MRPNLSLNNIAGVLAALGTSAVIAACGGDKPDAKAPVNANEVNTTSTPAGAQASCSAGHTAQGHCAGKADPAGAPAPSSDNAASPASTTGNAAAAPSTPSTGAASATGSTPAATADATKAAATDPKAATTTKPKTGTTATAPGKKPAAGQASCGAGTCSADMKKKIL